MNNNLFSSIYDLTDEVIQGNIEKVAEIITELGNDYRHTQVPTIEEQESRPVEDFALTLFHPRHGTLNKYACYDRNLVALNIAFLDIKKNEIPDEIVKMASSNLKLAAERYKLNFPKTLEKYVDSEKNIKSDNIVDVTNIDKKAFYLKLQENTEPIEKIFALKEKKKYPIHTPELIKKASDYFDTYSLEIEVPDRLEFSRNVFHQMVKNNIDVPPLIDKLANLSTKVLNEDFKYHVRTRKTMTQDEDNKNLYDQLLEKTSEWSPVKIASALDKLDKKTGIQYYYNRNISDPITSTLGVKKEASYEIDDRTLTQTEWDDVLNDNLSEYIDSNTQDELKSEEGIEIFKSLPQPIRVGILSRIN